MSITSQKHEASTLAEKVERLNGKRVRLIRDVDRFPNFAVKSGEEGTLRYCGRYVAVEMDNFVKGCEEWDNHIIWDEGEWESLLQDVEVIEERRGE